MKGNLHVQFLGGKEVERPPPYPVKIMIKAKGICKVSYKGIDLGYTIGPLMPCYGDISVGNIYEKESIPRAYDKNGKWVTYEETDDPVLKKLLSEATL